MPMRNQSSELSFPTFACGLSSWNSPPRIKNVRIVENPFDDIVPRITATERRAQQQARIEAKQESDKRDRRAKAKK